MYNLERLNRIFSKEPSEVQDDVEATLIYLR